MTLSFRYFDFKEEDCGRLFEVFEKVWNSSALRDRWKWEYIENPRSEAIKILVAEDEGKIAGYTTRLPFELKIRHYILPFYFSVNSMVDPAYGRRGIMKNLYLKAAETMPLLYSKGTTAPMYRVLMKIGYQKVEPNNYMVRINSPARWLFWRLGLFSGLAPIKTQIGSVKNDFKRVERFGPEFDRFWLDVCDQYPGIVVKDCRYMNWRYVDIPHKTYESFYRMVEGDIVSTVVFRTKGNTGTIVDIIWNPAFPEEPGKTIRFITRYAKSCGMVKTVCWATYKGLRRCLKKRMFFERKETPHFSVLSKSESLGDYHISDASALHFVHGDGDTEYIG